MSDKYVKQFYNEVCENLEGDYKIILEPNRNITDNWVEYDTVKWEIEEPIQKLVNKLLENTTLSFEEKVLELYKFICLNYIYDDNVLYFFKKDCSDINNIKYIELLIIHGKKIEKNIIEEFVTNLQDFMQKQ